MPNRILKETICTSEEINGLSAFEETVFYRLIVNADDYGTFDARPELLKSRLFPLREDVTKTVVCDAVEALVAVGLVELYVVDKRPYLHLATWAQHQRIRNCQSRYPMPDAGVRIQKFDELRTIADNCCQLTANEINCCQPLSIVAVIQSNPIQSESESNPHTTRARAREGDEETSVCVFGFDKILEIYPKKRGAADAKQEWISQGLTDADVPAIVSWVETAIKSEAWTKEGGRYIPNLAKFLRERYWLDAPPPVSTNLPATYEVKEGECPW